MLCCGVASSGSDGVGFRRPRCRWATLWSLLVWPCWLIWRSRNQQTWWFGQWSIVILWFLLAWRLWHCACNSQVKFSEDNGKKGTITKWIEDKKRFEAVMGWFCFELQLYMIGFVGTTATAWALRELNSFVVDNSICDGFLQCIGNICTPFWPLSLQWMTIRSRCRGRLPESAKQRSFACSDLTFLHSKETIQGIDGIDV